MMATEDGSDERARRWAELPAPVRARLLALAATTIGELPAADMPGTLRPFAKFAPRRRARLAATALSAALDGDAAFRSRVAERLDRDAGSADADAGGGAADADRDVVADGNVVAGGAEAAGSTDVEADDPVTQAALLFLRRPPDWPARLDGLAARLDRDSDADREGQDPQGVDAEDVASADRIARLTDQLHAERTQARAARDQAKADIAELKAANTALRRTLKVTRDRLAAAEHDRDAARGDLDAALADRAKHDSAHAATVRRLRSQLDEATASAEASKRAVRAGRDAQNARLRLLLETIRTAASGLTRELALPSPESDLAPADTVEMRSPGEGIRSMADVGGDASRLLADALALPHPHLIVDGYNVTKTAWPALPLADQRSRLVTALGGLVGRTGVEATVVFDGADLLSVPTVPSSRGVRVRFSPAGVTADDVIREIVDAEPSGRVLVVVTSDAEIVADVRRAGATPVPSAALLRLLSSR